MLWRPGLNVVGIFWGVVLSTLPFSFPGAFPKTPAGSSICHVFAMLPLLCTTIELPEVDKGSKLGYSDSLMEI